MPSGPRLFLPILLCAAGTAAQAAGIRRCEGADGVTIYTDRECSALGAVDRKVDLEPPARALPPGVTPPGDAPLLRTDCARRADTLLFDLRRAFENRNVNRVAGLYHWPGTGRGAARHVMDRLQRLVDAEPASIEFIYPEAPRVEPQAAAFSNGALDRGHAQGGGPDDDAPAHAAPVAAPIGLRLELGEAGLEPARELRLVRNAECWWFAF
jgi:hypothetical protein